jgi:hypothetical protein
MTDVLIDDIALAVTLDPAEYVTVADVTLGIKSLDRKNVGDLIDENDWLIIKNLFTSGIPDIFTTKGDTAAGTAAQAVGRVPVGANTTALISNGTTPAWGGGTLPIGMIILWSGAAAAVPTGWHLCNGAGGTIDLRGRFVVGAGSTYAVGATGGAIMDLAHTHTPDAAATANNNAGWTDHTHTVADTTSSASHNHTITATSLGASAGYASDPTAVAGGALTTHTHTIASVSSTTHTHTNPDTTTGGNVHTHTVGETASSLTTYPPPYYALCYIQRVS